MARGGSGRLTDGVLRVGTRPQRTGESGGGVTSLALPSENQLAWWYGGNGATIPAEIDTTDDGQPVAAWNDKSANAYHVSQASGTVKPTYRKSVNGRGGVEFDGGDRLTRNLAGGILANLNTYSLYVVFKTTTTNLGALYAEGRSSSDTPVVTAWLNNPAPKAQHFHRDDASVNAAPVEGTANDGSVHVLTARRITANSWSLRLDGAEIATSTNSPTTTTIDRLTLGALVRTGVSGQFTGTIFTIAAYSEDNYATVEPLLGAHYGVTMLPLP